jgi:hypothetical protein
MGYELQPRSVEDLKVPATGSVVRGGKTLPWRLVDGAGVGVEHVNLWITELYACDCSPTTLPVYAYDLLSWTRFLDAAMSASAATHFSGTRRRAAESAVASHGSAAAGHSTAGK